MLRSPGAKRAKSSQLGKVEALALVCLALGLATACNKVVPDGGGSAPGASEVNVTRGEAVVSPAVWASLWGSWPPGRHSHGAAYDSDRKLIVVYGGEGSSAGTYLGDTWEWNGTRGSWSQKVSTKANPGERSGHAMAYDPVSQKTFVSGGWQPASGFYFQEPWEWDGPTSAWSKVVSTGDQPMPRHDHTMLYDADRKKMVMFGGQGLDPNDVTQTPKLLNDVWEWDVTARTWAKITTTGTPSVPAGRFGHSMAYDGVRKKFVIKGGRAATTSGTVWVNETWEYDPVAKSFQQFTGTGLSTYYGGSEGYEKIAFDPGLGKTVLYSLWNYTYVWDPVTPAWTLVPTVQPTGTNRTPPYGRETLLYDSSQSKLVIFGSLTSSYDRLLFQLDTATWTFEDRSVPVNGPIQRQGAAIAFDSKRGKLRVFGGYSSADGLNHQDMWEWSGTDAGFKSLTDGNAKPGARQNGEMVYDSKRDRLLLYGGSGASYFTDLWSWDPTEQTWSQVSVTGVTPGAVAVHRMFYDAARDKVLLFYNNTVWEYDPALSTWKNRTESPASPVLSGRSFSDYEYAFDSDRGKVLLIGGAVASAWTSDVMEWDTTTGKWSLVPPAAGNVPPNPRYSDGIVYDPGRRVVMLFAGYVPLTGVQNYVNDSWEWNPLTSTWAETTPTGVKPLPRQNPLLVYDSVRGSIFEFGGQSVPGDTTYGPQEIWAYSANTAPRDNGAGCNAATAASCKSGNCVDGVCCAQTALECAGLCLACNVAGKLGTCSPVLAGQSDDTCAGDQVCDATQKCKARVGTTCILGSECGTGNCVDGVCCDTACTDTCKSCNVSSARGKCTNVPSGEEDPNGAPLCQSSAEQGRFCDGNGVCTNAAKPAGKACTASGQCASAHCIDGVCCNTACANTCYTCSRTGSVGSCTYVEAGLQDHSATTPCDSDTQYCSGSGTCAMNKKINGGTCSAAADCGSGYCVDGRCCNSTCLGTCQSCAVTGQEGRCVNVPAGGTDTNATTACTLAEYCSAAGTCESGKKANGLACAAAAECGSGFCADGVCCNAGCQGACMACNLTGDGTCTGVPTGAADLKADVPCLAPNYCTADHTCTMGKKPNGGVCGSDFECASNTCVDGTCCETACVGTCRSCKNATGTCVLATEGQDPRSDCKGQKNCGGTCNGQGACRFAAEGLSCSEPGCQSDGYIRAAGKCDGSGYCNAPLNETSDCKGFACYTDPADGMAKCKTSCEKDPDCASRSYCDQSQCPKAFDAGHACTRNAQCLTGSCSDGVCCNINCDQCGSCNMPGKEGTCVPIPAGTDPEGECVNSASDPTGKCGGFCNGKARCVFPSAGSTCGTCKACDGSGKCSVTPEDDVMCGDIDCDGLDTSCADYRDIKTKRCATLGACKPPNALMTCTDVTSSCPVDAGAGGTGGAAGTGGIGGAGARDGGSAVDGGASDSGTGGTKGGGGGGCGCDLSGPSAASFAPSLLLAAVAGLRRRKRDRRGSRPRGDADAAAS